MLKRIKGFFNKVAISDYHISQKIERDEKTLVVKKIVVTTKFNLKIKNGGRNEFHDYSLINAVFINGNLFVKADKKDKEKHSSVLTGIEYK